MNSCSYLLKQRHSRGLPAGNTNYAQSAYRFQRRDEAITATKYDKIKRLKQTPGMPRPTRHALGGISFHVLNRGVGPGEISSTQMGTSWRPSGRNWNCHAHIIHAACNQPNKLCSPCARSKVNRPVNRVKDVVQPLTDVFNQESQHKVTVFLQQRILAAVTTIGISIRKVLTSI